jgi:hypothetical protein
MAPAVLAIIAATILVTSFISGIFGMAGGIILLGVLLIFLDVAPAMMLFGTIQTAANGWRAALWVRYVDWGIVWRYLVGSTLMFLALRWVAVIPSKAVIYLGLGLIPFAADFLPKRLVVRTRLTQERRTVGWCPIERMRLRTSCPRRSSTTRSISRRSARSPRSGSRSASPHSTRRRKMRRRRSSPMSCGWRWRAPRAPVTSSSPPPISRRCFPIRPRAS